MPLKIEKLLVVVFLAAGVVLLVGEVIDGDWLRAGLWALLMIALAFLNRRLLFRSTRTTE